MGCGLKLAAGATLLLLCACATAAAPEPDAPQTHPTPSSPAEGEAPRSVFVGQGFIGQFPVQLSPDVPQGQIEMELHGYLGTDYGELARRDALRVDAQGRLRIDLARLALSKDELEPRYRECTFLIDCAERPVVEVGEQAKAKLGPKPKLSELSRFVDQFIETKSLERGLDLPSQTAVSRSGDCTEHALLLVALARFFGYPARDISGLVVIAPLGEAPKTAFGHAWAEVHDGKGWRRVDAALNSGGTVDETASPRVVISLPVDEKGKKKPFEVHYVPMRVRRDESPGYTRHNMSGLDVIHVNVVHWPAPSR